MSHPDQSTPSGTAVPPEQSADEELTIDPTEAPIQEEADEELGRTVAALTADDIEPAGRRKLLGRLVTDIRRRGPGFGHPGH